jgi:hypothetical protein
MTENYPDYLFEEAARRELANKEFKDLTDQDEIVLEEVKMFHLESMNERTLWIGVYTEGGKTYHLNISADGDKLRYYWSDETT